MSDPNAPTPVSSLPWRTDGPGYIETKERRFVGTTRNALDAEYIVYAANRLVEAERVVAACREALMLECGGCKRGYRLIPGSFPAAHLMPDWKTVQAQRHTEPCKLSAGLRSALAALGSQAGAAE